MKETARPGQVTAVAGGTTVAAVADMITASPALKETIFVPARGGLGEAVELEANYIVSLMARRSGGQYRLLHVPEQLSEEAVETLVREPHIREVLELVGRPASSFTGSEMLEAMASRRKSSPELLDQLEEKGAVGEAFGYYFNARVTSSTAAAYRPQFGRLENVEMTIAVAGGAGKAEAVAAVCPVSGGGHTDHR